MEILKKQLELSNRDYYKTHLSIINALLPVKLSPREIDVLSMFMSFNGDLGKDRFGATAKKFVRKEFNLSHSGLANYMKSLMGKGFIKKEGDSVIILPLLKPNIKYQLYQFKLVNKDGNIL